MHNFKSFYEGYHKNRHLPKRIISKKDFTYRNIVGVLDKFCRGKNVLDIGSGVGTLDLYLAQKGRQVTGIEISQRAVDIARQSQRLLGINKIKFIRGDFFQLKIREQFPFVICSEVLEHLSNEQQAINKIYRLIKPEGLLLITVPSQNAPLIKLGAIKKFDQVSGHLRRYTLDSLRLLLEKNQFKVIYTQKTEGLVRNSLYVFRLNLIIKLANKFPFISDLITWLDNITLKLLGESQIIIVAKASGKV